MMIGADLEPPRKTGGDGGTGGTGCDWLEVGGSGGTGVGCGVDEPPEVVLGGKAGADLELYINA